MVIEDVLPKIINTFHSEDKEAIASIAALMQRLTAMVPENVELRRLYALSKIHQVSDEHPEEIPVILDWDEYEWQEAYDRYAELFSLIGEQASTQSYEKELIYLAHNPAHCQALIELIVGDEWVKNEETTKRFADLINEYAQCNEQTASIAICYLTHGHPEAIEEVLEQNAEYFAKYGIDVFYLDDLMDEPTKAVIGKYRRRYQNIFHIHTKTLSKWNSLVNNLFSEKKYDYIWPSKDRGYFTEKLIRDVVFQANKGRDAIVFGSMSYSSRMYSILYHDPAELYGNFSIQATSINSIVYRADVLFKPFQIEQDFDLSKREKYQIRFFHFWALYNTCGEKNESSVKVIRRPEARALTSDKATSMWSGRMLEIWGEDWVKVNDNLPACYSKYKDSVIKEVSTLPWLLGDKSRLIELKKEGELTKEKFDNIRQNWPRVSDVPIEDVEEFIEKE